mmetsp:Transcript_15943/g.22186  ORF Transcript_15943/g.22186 Transcript_15943/m.22186 type:complete len:325 (-) Transcript_15943:60-1034(-)
MDKVLAIPLVREIQGLSWPLQVASVAGLLYLSSKAWFILRLLWTYFLRPNPSFAKYKGTWAIVTGSSYGIGASFAQKLASHGINVILMARSKDKLDELAKEIETKYNVKTLVIPFDFATKDSAQYDGLKQQFDKLDISILVNNVGVLTSDIKFFLDHTTEEIDWITHVNISSVNHMTRILLPTFLQKKRGLVLNVASISGNQRFNPIHFFGVYGSTKSYVIRLTQALDAEYGGQGVEFLAIIPSFVTSKMSHFRKGSTLVLTEDELTTAALHKVGQNLIVVQPHWRHLIQHVLWLYFPWLVTWTVFYFKKQLDARTAKKQQKSE